MYIHMIYICPWSCACISAWASRQCHQCHLTYCYTGLHILRKCTAWYDLELLYSQNVYSLAWFQDPLTVNRSPHHNFGSRWSRGPSQASLVSRASPARPTTTSGGSWGSKGWRWSRQGRGWRGRTRNWRGWRRSRHQHASQPTSQPAIGNLAGIPGSGRNPAWFGPYVRIMAGCQDSSLSVISAIYHYAFWGFSDDFGWFQRFSMIFDFWWPWKVTMEVHQHDPVGCRPETRHPAWILASAWKLAKILATHTLVGFRPQPFQWVSGILGKKSDVSMISRDFWWFLMIFNYFRWFWVIFDDFGWLVARTGDNWISSGHQKWCPCMAFLVTRNGVDWISCHQTPHPDMVPGHVNPGDFWWFSMILWFLRIFADFWCLVARSGGDNWSSGHQKWFPWPLQWPERVTIGSPVTRNGFHGISGEWCQLDFSPPETASRHGAWSSQPWWFSMLLHDFRWFSMCDGRKRWQLDFLSPKMVSMTSLVARNSDHWISGHQNWFPWHFWWPEMVSIGFHATRNHVMTRRLVIQTLVIFRDFRWFWMIFDDFRWFLMFCGQKWWCQLEFWSPEIVSLASPVARNCVNWMSELVSMEFLVARNGVNWISCHQKWFPWHFWWPEMVPMKVITKVEFWKGPCMYSGLAWFRVMYAFFVNSPSGPQFPARHWCGTSTRQLENLW